MSPTNKMSLNAPNYPTIHLSNHPTNHPTLLCKKISYIIFSSYSLGLHFITTLYTFHSFISFISFYVYHSPYAHSPYTLTPPIFSIFHIYPFFSFLTPSIFSFSSSSTLHPLFILSYKLLQKIISQFLPKHLPHKKTL